MDTLTHGVIATLKPSERPIDCFAIGPDGKHAVFASGTDAFSWDAESGQVSAMDGHTASIHTVDYSPDGKWLVTTLEDKTIRLWEVGSTNPKYTLVSPDYPVKFVRFSPDGTKLLTVPGGQTAAIWDLTTQQIIGTLKSAIGSGPISSAVFKPDGKQILTGHDSTGYLGTHDSTARIWDISGKLGLTLSGHTGGLKSVAFSPDGSRIVTASIDTTARVWDAETGRELVVLRGHTGTVNSAEFSPDGTRIVTASDDQTVRIWDSVSNAERYKQRLNALARAIAP